MERGLSKRFSLVPAVLAVATMVTGGSLSAQTTSGTLSGVVKDPSGAVVPNASVLLQNRVSGFSKSVVTDQQGRYYFPNLQFDSYQLSVTAPGLNAGPMSVSVSNGIPVIRAISVVPVGASETVNVETPADLTETDPNFHTDIDRRMIQRLPVETPTSELSSIVTELSPGVAADSNGLLHGLGDHNEVSFSIDGQPITDQQSKVFSNQVPADAVQSLQVLDGAPPAEFGDKTSLVVVATTRSGQGITKPNGVISASYGSFGTTRILADMAYGGEKWGNFISASALESGRFLDAPEFAVYHDKGNEENFFDRIDRQFSDVSSLHMNLQYTRSLFQTPNSYDTQFGYVAQGLTSGITDQRSKIETYLFSPTYTRTLGTSSVFNIAPYIRRDTYRYIPSANLLNDLGPIQQESVSQARSLTNAGIHADLTFTKGPNVVKFGAVYQQTFLRENDTIGIVDSTLNAPCFDINGDPSSGGAGQCSGTPAQQNVDFNPILAPYDLTRGGSTYLYHGQTDVKQLALYGEDTLTAGNWLFNLGIRGDIYNGLAIQRLGEPRVAISYNVKKTGTVLRVSYARTQETPFNENLVLSSKGCTDPVIQQIFLTLGPCDPAPFNPGFRNEFHAGFSQSAGRHFVLSADWITKYTHNAYDFSVLGATPITFPIEWKNSKIPGYALAATLTQIHGLSVRTTFSSLAARFFNPQIGGVGATVGQAAGTGVNFPFRIDHDERFNQTTHVEYALPFRRRSAYLSFNWKFDSGLVAGSVPCYNTTDPNSACGGTSITIDGQPGIDLSGLTPDEQFTAGLICNGVAATQSNGFQNCLASQLTSNLVKIPAPGTEDDDRNPQRIQPRNLFDMELGDDNLVPIGRGDRYHIGASVTAVNLTNKVALYNFLSTFSGTHYVTPRTVTGEIAFHF